MKFWISAEMDATVGEIFRPVRKAVETTLNDSLGANNYGESIEKLAIVPMIFRPESESPYKERRLIKWREKTTDYRLPIDYKDFLGGDEVKRKALLVQNILTAVEDIDKKCKGSFDGKRLSEDVRTVFREVLE